MVVELHLEKDFVSEVSGVEFGVRGEATHLDEGLRGRQQLIQLFSMRRQLLYFCSGAGAATASSIIKSKQIGASANYIRPAKGVVFVGCALACAVKTVKP